MPARHKVTDAIITDIEDANQYNYTAVPNLHIKQGKKVGVISAIINRYNIETCLYAVEKWELHVTNLAIIAVTIFLARSLYTLVQLVMEYGN